MRGHAPTAFVACEHRIFPIPADDPHIRMIRFIATMRTNELFWQRIPLTHDAFTLRVFEFCFKYGSILSFKPYPKSGIGNPALITKINAVLIILINDFSSLPEFPDLFLPAGSVPAFNRSLFHDWPRPGE